MTAHVCMLFKTFIYLLNHTFFRLCNANYFFNFIRIIYCHFSILLLHLQTPHLHFSNRPGSFEIILYVDKDLEFSEKWGLAGAGIIENGKEVEFKNFSTKIHKVSTSVTYKLDD